MRTIDTTTTTTERGAHDEETLVCEHLQLVHYVVAEVAPRLPAHVQRAELVSAGMLGLVQAAKSFDPERGIAFDRFASTRIRGAILDELRGRDWASRSVRVKARALQASVDRLTNALGRTPTSVELAADMGVDVERVQRITDDVHRASVINYEALSTDGDAESFLAVDGDGTPDDFVVDAERRGYLADAIAALPPRLRLVIMAYFFEERTMQDIADELGVSESRISQLRTEALALLKDGLNSQLDPEALAA
ncbi:MAG TPA: FliA/WhiG family RNA polymerase sigma factor, partial [Acidimicrobiia bacterium]|nr:FliA/WhiG family RNA polymerase sigma factor [Acidimicrobiia bacterium]